MMPLNKKKPRTKVPKIQCLVIPCVLQDNCQCTALKKQHTKKNKEKAAECVKLLVRRVNNSLPGDVRCPHWRLLFVSPAKLKSI